MIDQPDMPAKFGPSAWLRRLGAVTFLVAGAGFLVEGWTDAGTLRRELSWALVTFCLTVLGILAARRLRETMLSVRSSMLDTKSL